jgi:glycosyltransferase involved in cell wall biosynthesis
MISVIIPAWNASRTLGDCLDALERQSVPRAEYELVVVDDGSHDGTLEIARRPGVNVLQQAHIGAAAARNLGVRASQGDLLFFTDADCAPAPDWIAQMRAPFDDPRVDGAKGIYATHQPGVIARFVQLEYEDKYDRLRRRATIDFIDTYSAAYRRAPIEAAGGFDPLIQYAEDQEFSFRMAARGARLVFAPRAVVYHQHANSIHAYMRKKYLGGYWKFAITAGRHHGKLVSDAHTPPVMKVQMLLVLGSALAALGGPLIPQAWTCMALGLLAFVLSTVPFTVKAWRKDRGVALAAPGVLLLRAVALTAGALVSLANLLHRSILRDAPANL